MSLTSDDLARLADMTVDRLMASRRAQWVDPDTHADDHAWVGRQRQRETEFVELRQKIITSACIWAVPLVMAFVVSSFWRELVRLIKGA